MKQLILRLKDEGKTILMNSHLLADVEEICDRIAILYKGELLATGKIADMLSLEDRINAEFLTDDAKFQQTLKEFAEKEKVEIAKLEVARDTLPRYFLRLIYEKNPDALPESLKALFAKKNNSDRL